MTYLSLMPRSTELTLTTGYDSVTTSTTTNYVTGFIPPEITPASPYPISICYGAFSGIGNAYGRMFGIQVFTLGTGGVVSFNGAWWAGYFTGSIGIEIYDDTASTWVELLPYDTYTGWTEMYNGAGHNTGTCPALTSNHKYTQVRVTGSNLLWGQTQITELVTIYNRSLTLPPRSFALTL